MNKIVSLVNEWDAFEQKNPGAEIADFCRYYLINEKQQDEALMVKGAKPPSDHSLLMKTIGFITYAFDVYYKAAMSQTKLPFPEAFYFLNTLRFVGQVTKTDLITQTMVEYTTGIDSIAKLVKAGYISERQHDTDKRAKLLKLTPEGEELLFSCYPFIGKATEMIFGGLDKDTVKLCISILSRVEVKHTALAMAVRHMDFEEMYAKVMAER